MKDAMEISLSVNGAAHSLTVEARATLVDVLREQLELTGTHVGCEQGVCGACTILVNDRAVRSCLMLAPQANGASITTIEGLAKDGVMSPIQDRMWANHAFQCGFCTPGFLMQIAELIGDGRSRTEPEWREALSGNLCRCTGYQNILTAVMSIAEANSGDER